jgi:hypothetical protein
MDMNQPTFTQSEAATQIAGYAVAFALCVGCNPSGEAELGVFDLRPQLGDHDSGAAGMGNSPPSSRRPQLALSVSAAEICPGECIELSAAASGGRAPYKYHWDLDAAGLEGPGPHQLCPEAAATYFATVTDASFERSGFEVGDSVQVTLRATCAQQPDAGEPESEPLALTLAASAASVCPGECVELTASATGGRAPYQFNWEEELSGPGPHRVCPTEATTYRAFAFDADFAESGLEVGAQTRVEIGASCAEPTGGPLAIAIDASASEVCAGECVTLTAVGSGGRAPYDYNWEEGFEGAGPHEVCPTQTTTYHAFAFDADFADNHLEVGATQQITVSGNCDP